MSSRLRSLDSKISFFAFADIITAVSGVLIFVALLLATDLGKPGDNGSRAARAAAERRLKETQARQAAVDAENRQMGARLAETETAPKIERLAEDINRLRQQLAEAQKKAAATAAQLAGNLAAVDARDRALGLSGLKNDARDFRKGAADLAAQAAAASNTIAAVEAEVARKENQLEKLRQQEGQLWIIPDQNDTAKEPILITVGGIGATIDRFGQPDGHRDLPANGLGASFASYLQTADRARQYLVFLIRPSGIENFEDLVERARKAGFEVGFDALEENREIHFTPLPPIEETNPPPPPPGNRSDGSSAGGGGNGRPGGGGPSDHPDNANGGSPPAATPAATNSPPAETPPAAPPPKKEKSWWQKLLEWLGLA